MVLTILALLACGLTVLFCLANQMYRSGAPVVSLWLFRTGEDEESQGATTDDPGSTEDLLGSRGGGP